MTALIPLTRGCFALVDFVDYDWAMQYNWFCTKPKNDRLVGYAARHGRGGLIWLHKEVLIRKFDLPPTHLHTIGDHRNGIPLDCTRGNLRWATHQMNSRNKWGFITRQKELAL